jgi:hypothetical protein
MDILLPVSLGEALDKLTILEIKLEKIKDDRIKDVKKEYDLLYAKLQPFMTKNLFFYDLLKFINEDIWVKQDIIRSNLDSSAEPELCKSILDENDRRFRVKRKINQNSVLKEQKGYALTTAFVLTHLGLGDNITSIGLVRYLSTCFDKVIVVCKARNYENIKLMYEDDQDITFYLVKSDDDISPAFGCNADFFRKVTEGYTVFTTGSHSSLSFNIDRVPLAFYEQMNLDVNIFWRYFHIPEREESRSLANLIKDKEYAFVHNQSSRRLEFTIDDIEKRFKISKDETLLINPNYNCYHSSHPFFKLANKFIDHPLLYYVDSIKKATYNIMCDSSFFCLAMHLDTCHKNNYVIAQKNYNFLFAESRLRTKFRQSKDLV